MATDSRTAANVMPYLLRGGCSQRNLQCYGSLPQSTVFYNIFSERQHAGAQEAIRAELPIALRERMGAEPDPRPRFSTAGRARPANGNGRNHEIWLRRPTPDA